MVVTNLRSAAGMAAIWVFAVAGVSATAWVAIDRAGRDIAPASASALPLASPGRPTPAAPKPAPPASTSAAQTTTPAAIPAPQAPSTPSQHPGQAPTPPAAGPAAAPAPTPSPAPTPVDQSISVPGGLVSARCTGAAITLLNAQPDNDWRVRVDTSNWGEVIVNFQRGQEDSSDSTTVRAVCTNGTPAFTTTTGG